MKNVPLFLLTLFAAMALSGYVLYTSHRSSIGVFLLFTGVILGAATLIMKKEINLWAQKRAGALPNRKEIDFLERTFALDKYIPPHLKKNFYQRVNLFLLDKEIIAQNKNKKVHHPVVLICGAYAAFMDQEHPHRRVPLPDSPVYVFYDHPFPSPEIQDQLHISEYHQMDGAFLFSIPHLMKGNEAPDQYLNIALYETVKATPVAKKTNIKDMPTLEELCAYGGYTLTKLEKYMGLTHDHIDPAALAITLFFIEPSRFIRTFPAAGKSIAQMFPIMYEYTGKSESKSQ